MPAENRTSYHNGGVQSHVFRVREAAELYVEDLIEAGDPIPADPEHGTIVIPAPAVVVSR